MRGSLRSFVPLQVGLLERPAPCRPRPKPPITWVDRDGRSTKPDFFNLDTVMGVLVFTTESVRSTDRQVEASGRNRSQVGMPFLAEIATPHLLDHRVLAKSTFNGALVAAAQHSGKEDQEIADEIHICHGYMSRFMRGVAQQWARRLIAFMHSTQSLAPLQWMAYAMGCEIVVRNRLEAERNELRARLAEIERHGIAA